MAYMTKAEAFRQLRNKNPRGAEAGTKLFYGDGVTRQQVAFRVEAEQVWKTDTVSRVMGLVWAGVCRACNEGFFQLSPTHPDELNENCAFCSSARCDGFNAGDTNVFNPRALGLGSSLGIRRRGRYEQLILDVSKEREPESIFTSTELIDAVVARMPVPEEGARDTRRQTITRALSTLSKERDGPLTVEGGKVIFYE